MRCPFNDLRECTEECAAYDGNHDACDLVTTRFFAKDLSESVEAVARELADIGETMVTPEVGEALRGLGSIGCVSEGLSEVARAIRKGAWQA